MNRYSPEMASAISAVCRNPATKIASILPDTDIQKVTSHIQRILNLLADNIAIIGQQQYLLVADFECTAKESNEITAASLVTYLNTNFNIIILDDNFNVIGLEHMDSISGSAVSEYSEKNDCTVFHVLNGLDVVIYAKGRTVKEMNARNPSVAPVTYKRYARHGLDYKQSLIEFYQSRVQYGQHSDHWKPPGDASQRILCREIAGRKTEMIFHSNLRNWLDEHLEGAVVLGTVKKVSDDETDIEIRLFDGPYFILEIKWVGNNGSTQYSDPRIRDGITQVKNYLDRDPQVREICLVVYDGRPLEKWKGLQCSHQEAEQWKEIKICMTEEFPPRGYGLVFFLESQDASKRKR